MTVEGDDGFGVAAIGFLQGASVADDDWWTNRLVLDTLEAHILGSAMSNLGIVIQAGGSAATTGYRGSHPDYCLLSELNVLKIDPVVYSPSDMPELIAELEGAIAAADGEEDRMVWRKFLALAREEERKGFGLVVV